MLLSAEEDELSPLEAIECLSEYTPKIRTKLPSRKSKRASTPG